MINELFKNFICYLIMNNIAYPLMWSHVSTKDSPMKPPEPLPEYYQGKPFWEYFNREESWYDDSNMFEDPFEDPDCNIGVNRMKRSSSHEILGVDHDASLSEIKQAYREKILETHPDKVGGDGSEFIKIQEAYQCLIS